MSVSFLQPKTRSSTLSGPPWLQTFSPQLLSRDPPLICINRTYFVIQEEQTTGIDLGPSPSTLDTSDTLNISMDNLGPYGHNCDAVFRHHPEAYPMGVRDGAEFATEDVDDDEDFHSEADIRHGILEAALELVPTHGWSKAAIVAAAESYGYPGMAQAMFPGGGADLANHFSAKCNAELKAQLEAEAGEEIQSQTKFVRDALIRRLEMTLEVNETWSSALSAMASPDGVMGEMKNLQELADDIWFYAGDKSTDMNWYIKRMLCIAVYKGTENYMLQDNSINHQKTWDFLDRTLNSAVQTGTQIRQTRHSAEAVVGSIFGAAATAFNVLAASKK